MKVLQKEKIGIHFYSHHPSNCCFSVHFIFVPRQCACREMCVDEIVYFLCGIKGTCLGAHLFVLWFYHC